MSGSLGAGKAAQANTSESKYLFFYMTNAPFGEFSQWYPSTFVVSKAQVLQVVGQSAVEADDDSSGNITFNCAEQFMMYCKAARFGDVETQASVMATDSPKEQKTLGRLTVGFKDASWDEVKSAIVEAGTMAKFSQNSHLMRKLLATGDRVLCEASSSDRVWGIGYTAKHAMAHERHWGENRLGKALMAVRERLRNEGMSKGEREWEYLEKGTGVDQNIESDEPDKSVTSVDK